MLAQGVGEVGTTVLELLKLLKRTRAFSFGPSPAILTFSVGWVNGLMAAISSLEGLMRGEELDGIEIRKGGLLAFADRVLGPLSSFL